MSKNKIIKYLAVLCLGAAVLAVSFFIKNEKKSEVLNQIQEEVSSIDGSQDEDEGEICEFGIPIGNYDVVEGTVGNGEFFSSLLSRLGVSAEKAYSLTESSKGVFDLRKIRVGNEYHAFYTKSDDPELDYLIYDIDRREYVKFTMKDTVKTEIHQREVHTVLNYAKVTINTSLWVDVKNSGAPILLALKLADVYAWTIDFFGLQRGDSFETVYETLYCGDELLSVETIHYASFVHSGKAYEAFYYQTGKESNTYWNEKGESMRKAFLKAPLSFSRISSGYGTRVHPVTRKVHQHTGVDYAAPKGTPVMSIGDGTVVFAGRKGNEGNMVKIKHNSVYTTAYLHLSKFGKGIKSGVRVSQGQIIGYVGSTGRSTGPHLDFRIWKNGSPVNPLKVSSPPAVPISKDQMEDFERVKYEAVSMKNTLLAEQTVFRILDNLKGDTEN